MSDPHDVSTHFSELQSQLKADGFDSTTPIGEVLIRLRASLLDDGFDLPEEAVLPLAPDAGIVVVSQEPESVEVAPHVTPVSVDLVVQQPVLVPSAIRVFSKFDAGLLQAALSFNYQSELFEHKGSFFVLYSSSPPSATSFTSEQIKAALRKYVADAKAQS